MAVKPKYESVPAAIQKSDIEKCAASYGALNAKPYRSAAPNSLVYVTFAGALDTSTGLYTGAHLFRAAVAGDADAPGFDFNKLPGGTK